MHKKTLREISKFLSGLVIGDFLTAWWLMAKGLIPLSVLGIQINQSGVIAGMAIDVILFAFLVHYGWKINSNDHTSRERTFHRVAGVIFGIFALAHLVRLIFNLPINILSWEAPAWISGVATIVAAFLAYTSFHITKK